MEASIQKPIRSDLKVIVIGASGTGKTSFVNKFTKNQFSETYKATIVSEFGFKIVEVKDHTTKLEVKITEGKNREIRKIFEHFNYNVIFLKRVSIGKINLGGLTRGTCRLLKTSEIEYLKTL